MLIISIKWLDIDKTRDVPSLAFDFPSSLSYTDIIDFK